MLLDREEMTRRLNSPRNLINVLPRGDNCSHLPLHTRATARVACRVPESLKVIAGVLAKTEGVSATAQTFEISESVVSRAKNGKGGAVVAAAVEQTTQRIRDLALEKLMASLGIIDDVSLSNCGAKDASTVARNLAGVIDKLTPQNERASNNVQLVIYTPRQKDERQFQVIDVKGS